MKKEKVKVSIKGHAKLALDRNDIIQLLYVNTHELDNNSLYSSGL